MSTAVLLSIAAGLMSALPLIAVAGFPGGVLLMLLAPLPLFLVGLSQGVASVAIAGTTLIVVVGLAVGLFAAIAMLVTLAAPAAILVRQALLNRQLQSAAGGAEPQGAAPGPIEWYPPGLLVTWLTGVGVVWLAVSLFVIGSGVGGFEAHLRERMVETLTMMVPQAAPEAIAQTAGTVAPIALGAGLVSWLLLLALNAVLAQGALARFGRNLRPAPDIGDIELPVWLAPALAATLVAAFLADGDLGFVARNLAMVLLLPFLFLGLSVVHVLIRRLQAKVLLFVAFYAVMLLFTWPAVIVVALGLLEQWLNLRRRFSPPDDSQEES